MPWKTFQKPVVRSRLFNCMSRLIMYKINAHNISVMRMPKYVSEIINKYSKRWIDPSHIYNFLCLYAFILILITRDLYSYSKFKELIELILNNTHDVVDFDSPRIDIYRKHKIGVIRIRIWQYSVKVCVLRCLLLLFFFFFFLLSL